MKNSPVIETERLVLRLFEPEDLDAAQRFLGHPEVMRFSIKGPNTREDTARFIERMKEIYEATGVALYAVIHKEDDTLIGYCGFMPQIIDGQEEMEVGYRLHPDYWHQGLATEAARAVRDYGFNKLGYRRLISIIEADNTASIRVAERVGLTWEKDAVFKEKVPVQIYSIEG